MIRVVTRPHAGVAALLRKKKQVGDDQFKKNQPEGYKESDKKIIESTKSDEPEKQNERQDPEMQNELRDSEKQNERRESYWYCSEYSAEPQGRFDRSPLDNPEQEVEENWQLDEERARKEQTSSMENGEKALIDDEVSDAKKWNHLSRYKGLVMALLFTILQFYCMGGGEDIETQATLQANLYEFVLGESPACLDSEYSCVDLTSVHDWYSAYHWVRQSIIYPVWGPYGGDSGVILLYLSLGEELTIFQRISKTDNKCKSLVKNFVSACSNRHEALYTKDYEWEDQKINFDKSLDREQPDFTAYETGSLKGQFYTQILTNASLSEADDQWFYLYNNSYFGSHTETLILMFLVIAPEAEMLTLLQIHFTTNRDVGSLTPSFTMSTFEFSIAWYHYVTELIYAVWIVAFCWDEVSEILGRTYSIQKTFPFIKVETSEGASDTISTNVYNYWLRMEFWNLVDWSIIVLGFIVLYLRVLYVTDFWDALDNLNSPGTNSGAYVDLNQAGISRQLYIMVMSAQFMIQIFRLFKYFDFHPRLGEITHTIVRAATSLFHFMIVFLCIILAYAMVGHCMFGRAIKDQFAYLSVSIMSMFRMITGDLQYQELEDGFGSTTQPFEIWGNLPIMMFYFGYFIIMIMLVLNIFLAIVINAYQDVITQTAEHEAAGTLGGEIHQGEQELVKKGVEDWLVGVDFRIFLGLVWKTIFKKCYNCFSTSTSTPSKPGAKASL